MSVNEQEMEKLQYIWTRAWWTFVILGAISLALGLFSLLNPQASATIPIQLVGVLIGIDGLFKIITAVMERNYNWTNRTLVGAAETIIGILVFYFASNLTTAFFTMALYFIGAIFSVWGVISIIRALRGHFNLSRLLIGIVQVAIGVMMFALTSQIAISIVWVTGLFFFFVGLLCIFAGLRMRQAGRKLRSQVMGEVVEGVVLHEDGETYYKGDEEKQVILIPNKTEESD